MYPIKYYIKPSFQMVLLISCTLPPKLVFLPRRMLDNVRSMNSNRTLGINLTSERCLKSLSIQNNGFKDNWLKKMKIFIKKNKEEKRERWKVCKY